MVQTSSGGWDCVPCCACTTCWPAAASRAGNARNRPACRRRIAQKPTRLAGDYQADLARWRQLKDRVSGAIVGCGGTISHQHGIGVDHAPWLAAEKGELGLGAMGALFRHFDPEGRMNPGKLVTP